MDKPLTGHYQGARLDRGRRVWKKDDSSLDTLQVPGRPFTLDDESGLFEWGTKNNRTVLLARAILKDILNHEPPVMMALDFTETILAKKNPGHFYLTRNEVYQWVQTWRQIFND